MYYIFTFLYISSKYPPGSYHTHSLSDPNLSLGLGALRAARHDLGRRDADDEAEEQGLATQRSLLLYVGKNKPISISSYSYIMLYSSLIS